MSGVSTRETLSKGFDGLVKLIVIGLGNKSLPFSLRRQTKKLPIVMVFVSEDVDSRDTRAIRATVVIASSSPRLSPK